MWRLVSRLDSNHFCRSCWWLLGWDVSERSRQLLARYGCVELQCWCSVPQWAKQYFITRTASICNAVLVCMLRSYHYRQRQIGFQCPRVIAIFSNFKWTCMTFFFLMRNCVNWILSECGYLVHKCVFVQFVWKKYSELLDKCYNHVL